MNKCRRNVFLVVLVVLSACVGFFFEHIEKQSYVTGIKSDEFTDRHHDSYDNSLKGVSGNEKININTATKEQLMELKGIGEVRAGHIIEYRLQNGGFEVIEDIMKIDGIGSEIFNGLKDYITVE